MLAEAVKITCNAHQLAVAATINRFGNDRPVITKVKDLPGLNIGNVVRYSRNDGHGVMTIIGRKWLALYTYCWGWGLLPLRRQRCCVSDRRSL